MSRASHRTAQFLRAAFARPADDEVALVDLHLPPPLRPSFARLSRAEQAHAVATLRTLLRQGHTDSNLLAAALVHDLGKSRSPLRLLDRVVVVLAQAFMPRRAGPLGPGRARWMAAAIRRGRPARRLGRSAGARGRRLGQPGRDRAPPS